MVDLVIRPMNPQLAGRTGVAVLMIFGVHGLDVEIDAGASARAKLPRSHDLIWLFTHMNVVTGGTS